MFRSLMIVSVVLVGVGLCSACPIPVSAPVYQQACYAPQQTYYQAPAVTYLAYPVTLQVAVPTVAVPAQQVVPQQVPMAPPVQQLQPQVQAEVRQQEVVAPQYAPVPVIVRQAAAYYAAPVAVPSYAAAGVGYGRAANVVVQRQVVRQRAVVAPARVVVRQRAIQRPGLLGRLFGGLRNRAAPAASRTTVIVR